MKPLIHTEGKELRRADFLNPAIEPELDICHGSDIAEPPSQPQALIDAIGWLAPGIELYITRFFFDPVSIQELVIPVTFRV